MDDVFRFVKLSPALDRAALSAEFRERQILQVRNLLEEQAAQGLARMLMERTPWGVTWQAGEDGPHRFRHNELSGLGPRQMQEMTAKLNSAMQRNDFAFIYSQYRISTAVQEGWSASPEHEQLLAELNSEAFLDFIREVTNVPEIRVCDAQASHYGPSQFLSLHQDVNTEENEDRLVAYVLSMCTGNWRPDWGGYLLFFDDQGDIVQGYRPRFNCLNMFRVPKHHSVSFVPPFAAGNRLAVTGWFRSR